MASTQKAKAEKGKNNASDTKKRKSNASNTKRKVNTIKKVSESDKLAKPIVEKRQFTKEEVAQRLEIRLWISLAVSVILELSNFGIIGIVGNVLSNVMFGLFGILAYIVPIVLFIGYMFLIVNFSNPKAKLKVFMSGILLLMLCALAQLIATKGESVDFYRVCSENKTGGGLLGGLIGNGLSSVLAIPGACVVIFAIIIICFIVITDKSFVGGIKSGYNATKSNIDRIKTDSEVYNERKEKDRRYNKKARGVINYEFKNPEAVDENLHEIHSIYKGPINTSKLNVKEQTVTVPKVEDNLPIIQENINIKEEAVEEKRIVEHEIYEVNIPTNRKKVEPSSVIKNTASMGQSEYEKDNRFSDNEERDENEPFKPKERIHVSKAAKSVMNTPAFAGVGMKKETDSNTPSVPDVSKGVATPSQTGEVKNVSGPTKKIFRYEFPPLSLLKKGTIRNKNNKPAGLSETAIKLQQILQTFGVKANVTNESRGPSVTRYELQPELGTKVSKITSLTDDIKLNLAAADIRIEAPIPGKAAVGIEVPNDTREPVFLRDLLESEELKNHPSKLAFAAGMDIAGNVIVADIAKMPHMLIAGTTGSGKSVFTNSILLSILFRADPTEVKLIIVDPKVVEFGVYNGIPHLLTPVVTDPRKAAGALAWAVEEMQDRYNKFSELGVRDVKGYNAKIKDIEVGEGEVPPQRMPQILIIIDELADLMMVAAKEVESSICRLAQLARAAGIHLVIATQRPSVDVVTGLIKANIPSRVALLVSSGIDSRTIIDINGAEKLLGNGDMLFYPSGYVKPVRLQGAFVSDGEVQSVVEFITSHTEKVEYNEEIGNREITVSDSSDSSSTDGDEGSNDAYFAEAGKFVIEKGKGSTSMLQRMFRVGFNRAARIMDQLYEAGVVGDEEGTKPRRILMTMEEFEEYLKKED